ncbi:hypothetical protein E2542_SST26190 [Spatholobus suberectus]|nr:hypothetical protein E2542_SST26190 [Spatholobus suberectus]
MRISFAISGRSWRRVRRMLPLTSARTRERRVEGQPFLLAAQIVGDGDQTLVYDNK